MALYRARQNDDGTYDVLDVPIFGAVSKGEKGAPHDIDEQWMREAIEIARFREKEQGYLPPLHFMHHGRDRPMRAGHFRLRAVRKITYDGEKQPFLFADLVGIPKDRFDQIKAGEWPYRSVEILDYEEPGINHLALLDTEEPFFRLPLLNGKTIEVDAAPAMVGFRTNNKRVAHALFSARSFEEFAPMSSFGATDLGDRIRDLLEKKEMTVEELGGAISRDPSTVSDIITGDIERPPDDVLASIAKALGTSLAALKKLLPDDKKDETEGGGDSPAEAKMAKDDPDKMPEDKEELRKLRGKLRKRLAAIEAKLQSGDDKDDDGDNGDNGNGTPAKPVEPKKETAKARAGDDAESAALYARIDRLEAKLEKREREQSVEKVLASLTAEGYHVGETTRAKFAKVGREGGDLDAFADLYRSAATKDGPEKIGDTYRADDEGIAPFAQDEESANLAAEAAKKWDELVAAGWRRADPEQRKNFIRREVEAHAVSGR